MHAAKRRKPVCKGYLRHGSNNVYYILKKAKLWRQEKDQGFGGGTGRTRKWIAGDLEGSEVIILYMSLHIF